ncbi:PTS galactitol transporter subunit IIB, partial [Escherichia coli]|nr:PTS galactitol transporter subunit IIB [Escherichia coli]
SLMDCNADKYNSYDLVVSSTKIDNPDVTTKVIVGAGLLTGIGEDEIFDAVKEEITK